MITNNEHHDDYEGGTNFVGNLNHFQTEHCLITICVSDLKETPPLFQTLSIRCAF